MPNNEPWDVPESLEGRATLLRLADEYAAAGQMRELGITLTRLANLTKQIGTGREEDMAMDIAGQFATRAVEVLRDVDDKRAMAAALRSMAGMFILGGVDRDETLVEALRLSQEAGDFDGQGWAHYARSAFAGPAGESHLEEAKSCFEKTNNRYGIALIQQRLGIRRSEQKRIVEAAESFAADGHHRNAEEAYVMAAIFGRKELTIDEREAMYLKAAAIAEKRGAKDRQIMYLETLTKLMKKARRKKAQGKYEEMVRSLSEP